MAALSNYDLTAIRARELFHYDPWNGLRRVATYHLNHTGDIIKGKKVKIDEISYLTHRVIWLHYYGVWPSHYVDHANRDKYDNRICNLREATDAENQYNKVAYGTFSKGVTFRPRKSGRSWQARIRIDGGPRILLGSFYSEAEAAEAYRQAALKGHGEFACFDEAPR